MSAQIITLPLHDDHFGNCPMCQRIDAFLNVERSHFAVCHRHRISWYVGWNLFDFWRHEYEQTWQRNDALLRTYRCVEPTGPRSKL